MNNSDMNKQTKVVWRQSDNKSNDSSDRPQSDNANIIPFPARPAPGKQSAIRTTGARLIRLSIRQVLRRTREHVLNHIRMTGKPANDQGNGEYSRSAPAARRATA
jgi:hypothetical protein